MTNTLALTILKAQATDTVKIIDVKDGSTFSIPSIYVVKSANSNLLDESSKCQFLTRKKCNCIDYMLEQAYKKSDTDAIEKYALTFDDTMLYCANPYCRHTKQNPDTSKPETKVFHAGCYSNFIHTCDEKKERHITKVEYNANNPTKVTQQFAFPVCSLRCHNRLAALEADHQKAFSSEEKRMNKIRTAIMSGDSSLLPRWDNDNIHPNGMTSISALLEWVTTEENGSMYFGGNNSHGHPNGISKDKYHQIIAREIRQKTG